MLIKQDNTELHIAHNVATLIDLCNTRDSSLVNQNPE